MVPGYAYKINSSLCVLMDFWHWYISHCPMSLWFALCTLTCCTHFQPESWAGGDSLVSVARAVWEQNQALQVSHTWLQLNWSPGTSRSNSSWELQSLKSCAAASKVTIWWHSAFCCEYLEVGLPCCSLLGLHRVKQSSGSQPSPKVPTAKTPLK